MTTIRLMVNLPGRSYPIYIGNNIFSKSIIRPYVVGQQVLIVTNETVAPLYLGKVRVNFKDIQCDELILPDGEIYKTLETVSDILDALVKNKHIRSTTLIALGGGVIGDMSGFAAACYQRGVNFIQLPTTLLSQVDASVGGKTGVNHPLAKNMIGAFHQPQAVFIDLDTLQTLPDREYHAGLAEVIKAALISDSVFFGWLEEHILQLMARDNKALQYAIEQACAIKVKIVVADEKEANIRALLNLGHTFGHAIEQVTHYSEWLHGEAVAIGIVLAAEYSAAIGLVDNKIVTRIKNILTKAKLPIRFPNSIAIKQMIACMDSDKKKNNKGVRLVLLKEIGQAVLSQQVDPSILEETLKESQQL